MIKMISLGSHIWEKSRNQNNPVNLRFKKAALNSSLYQRNHILIN